MCYRPQVTPAPNRGRRTVAFGANVSETGVALVRAPRVRLRELRRSGTWPCSSYVHTPLLSLSL